MTNTVTSPDLASRLRQTWPTLTADQRQVILDLVWTLAGSESELMAEIEDLEDELAIEARKDEIKLALPFDEVIAEIEAEA
jgi:hypothetical protein